MIITKRTLLKGMAAAPLAAPALVYGTAGNAESHAAMAGSQVPGYYRYRVGDIEVTALLDGYNVMPTGFVLGYDEDKARESTAKSYRRFVEGSVNIPVNGYVIKTNSNLILMDAGAPSLISPTLGGLTGNLAAAGFDPSEFDTVLFTHLHPDHVGALLTAEGTKAFPNAQLICSEADWGFTHNDDVRAASPEEFRGMIDLVRNFVAPYNENKSLFSGEKELFTGITSIPLPGHTPGHTGYAIHSGTESLLIWGDVVHFTTLQFSNPSWGVVFDTDPALAVETRLKMLDRASADRMAVAGMHIDFPGFGYVEISGDAYQHINAPWLPS
ncbi:MAG: MBL fold metallo-hydrolase [Rhodobacteraceae bacterium]|nr:MBL fold metallo-hydrolase [Paracoccaceae bacterium]